MEGWKEGRKEGRKWVSEYIPPSSTSTGKDNTAAFDSFLPTRLLATHRYLPPMSSFLTPIITSWLSPVVRFVMTFWLKGNKLPSFVQFTAGAGSPLTAQLNVTLDPIRALWFSGALIIVGFLPSIKGNKNVFFCTTSNNPNLLLLTKLTIKSYLQLISLKKTFQSKHYLHYSLPNFDWKNSCH